jgi:hypothetical protein
VYRAMSANRKIRPMFYPRSVYKSASRIKQNIESSRRRRPRLHRITENHGLNGIKLRTYY